MIMDNIKHYKKYEILNSGFEKAFNFLNREDIGLLAAGRYDIDGNEVYALVQEYETKCEKDCKYEAHRKYADIQYMLEGAEYMGYLHVDEGEMVTSYDEEKDFLLLSGEMRLIPFKAGEFFIFFQEDAHMPGIYLEKRKVKKVVVKVRIK